jgi:hypothetical protein
MELFNSPINATFIFERRLSLLLIVGGQSLFPYTLQKSEQLSDRKLIIEYERGPASYYFEYLPLADATYRPTLLIFSYKGQQILKLVALDGSLQRNLEVPALKLKATEYDYDKDGFPEVFNYTIGAFSDSLTRDGLGIIRVLSNDAFELTDTESTRLQENPFEDYGVDPRIADEAKTGKCNPTGQP